MAKILIVEDDQFLHNIIKTKLTEKGHQVVSATNGVEAPGIAEAEKPHLILLDIMLPGVDGFAVAREVRSNPDTLIKQTPIIILSNLSHEETSSQVEEIGIDGYLVKMNVTPDEILGRVEKCLAKYKVK